MWLRIRGKSTNSLIKNNSGGKHVMVSPYWLCGSGLSAVYPESRYNAIATVRMEGRHAQHSEATWGGGGEGREAEAAGDARAFALVPSGRSSSNDFSRLCGEGAVLSCLKKPHIFVN